MEDKEQLLALTADIVASHVSNNSVAVGDVANLVQQVHAALSKLGSEENSEDALAEKREPAVSVRSSVKPDHIVCLVCGSKQRTLKRHLQSAHQMTPSDYRQEFGLKSDYPMVAQEYSERRSEMAKLIGLGRQRKKQAPKQAVKRSRKAKEEGAQDGT